MDVRFVVDHLTPKAERPPALADYVETLKAWYVPPQGNCLHVNSFVVRRDDVNRDPSQKPLPPLKLDLADVTYYLEGNTVVHQVAETVSVDLSDEDDYFTPAWGRQKAQVPILKETCVDAESKLRTATCSVRTSSFEYLHTSSNDLPGAM